MADEIEDLPAVNSLSTDEFRHESEQEIKRRKEKRSDELLKLKGTGRGHEIVIDDVIEFLQDIYFPKSNGIEIARPATIAPRVDYYFLQAQERIQAQHPKTMESSIRYLCYKNGWDIFREHYKTEIQHCESLYNEKSASDDVEVYASIRSTAKKITQGTIGGRVETGFTTKDKELIQKLARVLGIADTGLLIVFFWIAAGKSTVIGQHLIDHGKEIEASFELQLKQRVHNMGFKR